jgi:hypothetical protein
MSTSAPNASRDSQLSPGAALKRPRSLMGTPVVPWILDVSGVADLSRPVRACRHLLSCAKATVIEMAA